METIRTINYAARTPIWNGLGQDISRCTTVEEALEQSGLDFTVHQEDIQTSADCPIPLEGYKANVREDGTPLGIVSTRYRVVQNRYAFAFLNELVGEGMRFERAGGLQHGRKVFILGRMPDRYILSGDHISPYIVFINSHDGTGSIKVLMTPIRMICLNMLNLALRHAARSWSAVHSGDVSGKLEDARNTLFYAHRYMQELSGAMEVLRQIPLSDSRVKELTEALIPTGDQMSPVQIKNIHRQRSDLLERYFEAPDLTLLDRSAYRFLNAVADHANHADPLRRRENFQEARFSRSVEGHPLVDRAYSLLLSAA